MNIRFHAGPVFLLACICLGNIALVDAADELEGIPLAWRVTSPMSERDPIDLKGFEGIKFQVEHFFDKRDDPASIGRSLKKIPIRKVTTNEDVVRFVTYHVKSLMSGLGLNVVESGGDVILNGAIVKYFVEEGRRYNAEVELQIALTDSSGKPLKAFSTTGTARRFGISYKADNYHEVLSDALVGAVHQLVGNEAFRKALIQK